MPSVNCSKTGSSDAFAYHWVGLDRLTNSTVEQDGVADFCVGGTPKYYSWYEIVPGPLTEEFAVNPGDAITSSVTYSASTGKYTLKLTDQSTGQGFSLLEACAATCDNSSAEVITEGYPGWLLGGHADFAEEHYDAIEAGHSSRRERQPDR